MQKITVEIPAEGWERDAKTPLTGETHEGQSSVLRCDVEVQLDGDEGVTVSLIKDDNGKVSVEGHTICRQTRSRGVVLMETSARWRPLDIVLVEAEVQA